MRSFARSLITLGCILVSAAPAHAGFIATPAALAANDSVLWPQLGSPGGNIAATFAAASSGGLGVTGLFGGAGGTVDQVCPAINCNYGPAAPGFSAGDFLILTEDANGSPSGPLAFLYSAPVLGAGLYLQLNAPGTFTATLSVIGGSSGTESAASDSSGDPVFLGALDGSSDITGIIVGISSCRPSSPGGCSINDFAVDTEFLRTKATTATPEPSEILPVALWLACLALRNRFRLLLRRVAWRKPHAIALLCATGLVLAMAPLRAQDGILPFQAAQGGDGSIAARQLPKSGIASEALGTATSTPSLPIWNYQVTSPIDGNTYGGYMVGASPFNRGARTTTIPVVLIPVVVTFHNTTSGFMTTFDPTGMPDAGCTGNQTAFSLVQDSPVFQSRPWTLNGISVGNTQYVDAFQRANFWQYVQNTGNAYHTLLSYTVGSPLTLTVAYSSASAAAEVERVGAGSCTNPTAAGDSNAAGYVGVVSINTVDAALQSYIAAQGITANQFPVFIMYNVVMSDPQNANFFYDGYHASEMPYPAVLTSPGQTYAIADIQTNGFFFNANLNTGIWGLSHEVTEWMDDPGGFNPTPAWGHIGQVTGCQSNLEAGDALTETNLPGISGPGGFTYYLQELIFYSWFFRIPSFGAGGLFSDNGTFTSDAGAVCH